MEYAVARSRYFISLARSQGSWIARCEVCTSRPAVQIHHMCGRIDELLSDPRYFLGVCVMCHARLGEDPAWAIEMGYSTLRNTPH